jgi:murein DD-endopeptidase MepM/ murein hydrolase activator NlpD
MRRPILCRAWRAALGAAALAWMGAGCGGSSPSNPAPPSAPTGSGSGTVSGTVTSRVTRQALVGIRVEVASGPDAGRFAETDARGAYRLDRLAAGPFDLRASGLGREAMTASVTLAVVDFALSLAPCGAVACDGIPAACNEALPLLQAPLAASVRPSNQFDHTQPQAGFSRPNDGRFTRWCGGGGSYDGHNGWDWPVGVGTPVLAAAAGEVRRAASESPFFCPFLGREVSGMYMQVAHVAPQGETFVTEYLHLSEFLVPAGARVTAGQPIGLSGNTGCSTGPHLHFAVYRQFGNRGQGLIPVDPFGWQGSGSDPWAADPDGAASPWLWMGAPPRSTVAGPAILEEHRVPAP